MAENVRRSIEFQFGVDLGSTENSIAGLERQLGKLKEEFANTEIGSARFKELGDQIQQTSSKLKTLDERFEGLGAEQKATAIAESFNVVVGAIGAVTGALVALGIESEAIENVERRILGVLTVITSLREVANGLQSFVKIWPILTANITKATVAIRAFALANPFTAILVAITAVVGAIALFTQGTKEATEAQKKLREEGEKFLEDQAKINEGVKQRNRDTQLLGKSELEQARIRFKNAKDDLAAARIANNRIETERRFLEEQRAGGEALLEVKKRELQSRKEEEDAVFEVNKATVALAQAKAKEAAEAKKQAEAARNARLELEGIRQVILQTSQEAINNIIFAPAKPGSLLDVRNLQGIDETLKSVFKSLEEIDLLELEDPIKFFSEEQLNILKRLRGELDTDLQQRLFARQQEYENELALFADNEDTKTQLTEEYEKDRVKIRQQYALETARNVIGITSQFLGTIAEINQQSLELQLAQAAGNQAKIDQINKEALERQKKLRIAQIIVSTAEAVINAFTSTSQIPPPFGQIIGSALAASYVALGAKSIATVNATTVDGGTAGGGFNNIPSGGGAFSLGGTPANLPTTGTLPGLGGGRLGSAPTVGTLEQEPLRAYVLAGDVTNGVQANIALNNRRRLAG